MVETDGFLRALAKGFTAAQLSKLVHPNVVAADITPSFRRQQPKTAGARRKVKKKPPAPRRDKAAPEARRAPLKAVEPNANDAEARLAKLEIEVFHKHRAKDESIRRRMHALSDHVGALGEKTSKMEARVTKVEQQQSARQRSEASAAAGARALAARVTQIDQRVTEQAEATHAQGEKIRTALARLSALQQKQEALGREQQHISTQVLALPRSLDIAPPPPRLSAASHAAAAYASDAPAAAQGSRRSSGGGSSARARLHAGPQARPQARGRRPDATAALGASVGRALFMLSSSSSSPLSTTRTAPQWGAVRRLSPRPHRRALAQCNRRRQRPQQRARRRQWRRRRRASGHRARAVVAFRVNLPPRSSYIPPTDEERRRVSGPPVSHLTGRCGPAAATGCARCASRSVISPRRYVARRHRHRRRPRRCRFAARRHRRTSPQSTSPRGGIPSSPTVQSVTTRAVSARPVSRRPRRGHCARHARPAASDMQFARAPRTSGAYCASPLTLEATTTRMTTHPGAAAAAEDPDEGGEAPTPGREFGALRDRYMRAFGKGASSKASPDSA